MIVLLVAHVSTNVPLEQSPRATSIASTPTSAPSVALALTLAPAVPSASNQAKVHANTKSHGRSAVVGFFFDHRCSPSTAKGPNARRGASHR